MSFEAMAWASKQKTGSSGAKLVLLMLADHANGHTGQCNPRHKVMAAVCEMTVETLKKHIANLEACGFIEIVPQYAEGVQLPNHYILNIEGGGGNFSCNEPKNYTQGGYKNSPPNNQEVNQERKQEEASQAPPAAKRKKSDNLTLVKWAELQKEQGTPLLSDDDAIFAYADAIKLPKDFLLIAWHMFKAKYKGSAKTYKDWRAAFRDHVRGNYLKAWAINRDGEFYLTDAGKQAQMERGSL